MKIFSEFEKRQAAKILACYGGDSLEKGGEGSRGGKVIGHTKSGTPIYEKKIGSTDGFGKHKSGKNAKEVYNNFNHESHKDFDSIDHEAAATAHGNEIFERHRELAKENKLSFGGAAHKKVVENDDLVSYHKEQKKLHEDKSSELYENSGEKAKDDAKMKKIKEANESDKKKEVQEKREKIKSLPQEDRNEISRLKNRLESLSHHHPQDDGGSGMSIKEVRANIKSKIDKIINK